MGLMQENARLWSEREAMVGHGAWRQHPGACGPPQSWAGSVMGEGFGQERTMVHAMMEAMRSSMGVVAPPKDRGMLGAPATPIEHGHGGFFHGHDSGFLGGFGASTKGNLMDMFNMVAGMGHWGSMQRAGQDWGQAVMGLASSGAQSGRTSRPPVGGSTEERASGQETVCLGPGFSWTGTSRGC